MKKVFLAIVVMVAFAACTPKSADGVVPTDTVLVDTTVVDTVAVDTIAE